MALSLTLTLIPSPLTADLAVGETLQLHATPANGVKWTSNNCTCVSVSSTGLAAALSAGMAIITATRGNLSASVTITVTVAVPVPVPDLPSAVLVVDTAIDSSVIVIVDTTGSVSSDGSVMTGTIAWGDNQTTVWDPAATLFSHLYAGPGTYPIVLTVVEAGGNTSTSALTLVLQAPAPPNLPPDAMLALTINAEAGSPITVSAAGSADPDGTLVSYVLTWGDSQQTTATTAPPATLQHTYVSSGTYLLTLTVTDNGGLTGIATISVTIQPAPPPPTPPAAALAYVLGGTVSQIYTVSTTGTTSPIASYTINWGDATIEGASTNVPASLTHVYLTVGSFSAVLTVTDSLARTATATLNVTIVAVPPTPVQPQATLTYVSGQYTNAPYILSTTGTTDSDGTLVSGSITWGDGTPAVTWGTTLPAQLSHVYGNAGTYTATMTVIDNDGLSGVATRTVVISALPPSNQPPIAQIAKIGGAFAGDTFIFSTSGTQDPDGSIASWVFDRGDGTSQTGTGAPPATLSRLYATVGIYPANFRVTDNQGALSSLTSLSVQVYAVPVPSGARNTYFDTTLVPRASWFKGYSLRPQPGASISSPYYEKQLLRPSQGGYTYSNNPAVPLVITYNPSGDTDPRKQVAAKVVVGANQVSLPNGLRLPLGLTNGHTYLIVVDEWWGAEWDYTNTNIANYKTFQIGQPSGSTSPCPGQHQWVELQCRFQAASGAPIAKRTARSYFPAQDPVTEAGTFLIQPERWTRTWVLVDRTGSSAVISVWAADTVTGPTLLVDQVSRTACASLDKFWLEYNTSSAFTSRPIGPLVAYVSNIAVLMDEGNVASLLVRPVS